MPQSETRNPKSKIRAAFTLLEILLALALIGLLAGVLVTGAGRMIPGKPTSTQEIFWVAVQDCRKAALRSEQNVTLRFDAKDKQFVAEGENVAAKNYPIPAADPQLTVDFLTPKGIGVGALLVGGTLVEGSTVPFVTFYGDGTCSNFRVQIRTRGEPLLLSIDPWTCAQVLKTEEKL